MFVRTYVHTRELCTIQSNLQASLLTFCCFASPVYKRRRNYATLHCDSAPMCPDALTKIHSWAMMMLKGTFAASLNSVQRFQPRSLNMTHRRNYVHTYVHTAKVHLRTHSRTYATCACSTCSASGAPPLIVALAPSNSPPFPTVVHGGGALRSAAGCSRRSSCRVSLRTFKLPRGATPPRPPTHPPSTATQGRRKLHFQTDGLQRKRGPPTAAQYRKKGRGTSDLWGSSGPSNP